MTEHVSPLRHQTTGTDVVHAVADEKLTICGFQYMSDHNLNGRPIPRAASTTRPLTCGRCRRKLMTMIYQHLQRMPGPEVETVWELAKKLDQ